MTTKSRHSLILLTMGLGLSLALILLWMLGAGSVLAVAAPVPASVPRTDGALKLPWGGMTRGAVEGPPVLPNAPAAELHVCDTCPYTTIQAAVDDATGEGVWDIKVATGVYTGVSARYGMTQVVYITKAVAIRGGYTTSDWDHADPEANPVTLNAEGRGRVLHATADVSFILAGLRFTGGDAGRGGGDNHGGGMYVEYAPATITGCQIYSNTAQRGGGVYLYRSPTTLNSNTITTNTATAADVYDGGGGVYLYESSATLDSNTVVSNTASGRGGGVHLHRSGATLDGNTFVGNMASDFGGGVYMYDSDTAALSGSRVMSNIADQSGGGLYLHNSDATLSGNTLSGNTAASNGGGLCAVSNSGAELSRNTIVSNTASGSGGGLYVRSSDATLVNNVVADNVAGSSGGGIHVHSDSNPRLLHTTIARNRGGDGSGVCVSHLLSDYSTVVLVNTILVSHTVGITVAAGDSASLSTTLWYGNTTSDWGGDGTILTGTLAHNHWGDPAFVDPAKGDYHIAANSAARDTGVDADVDTDIDGEPRPQGPGYDIGADEHRPCFPLTSVEITGTSTTTVGIGTVFTATVHPPTATVPITYTWGAMGQLSFTQSGGISHTAVFTWHSGGSQVVTVTGVNECGSVVSSTHFITIEATACNALTDLGIDGSPTTTVDIPTVFTATATPSDVAQPVTYTWEATGQTSITHSGGISDTATFTWGVTGPQVVTVTVMNECGGEVSRSHAITVEASLCIGLTDVGVSGASEGYTGALYAFTGVITPSDATEPVAYAWTPEPDSGQGTDEVTFSWATTGNKTISVEVENCGGSASDDHAVAIGGLSDEFVYLPQVLRSQ